VAPRSILVIKLGALGDFVQATGPFAAIRAHHRLDRITLLTTRPFQAMAEASGYFDAVCLDDKPKALALGQWLALRKELRNGRFERVYDLQTSDRSSFYYHLFRPGPMPQWSGIASGASHPHANPNRDRMHTIDRQRDQLAMAGITNVPDPDLSWASADLGRYSLPQPYSLLVPGGAPHRPAKRWPAKHFNRLALDLARRGISPVILGVGSEVGLAAEVARDVPGAVDLTGKTDLLELAALARQATVAVGNDTGPMHVTAAGGCPSLVLFSAESDPALCAPRGRHVVVLRTDDLAELSFGRAERTVESLISG